MSLRSFVRSAVAGTAAVALSAGVAQAQVNIQYNTTGVFTMAPAGCSVSGGGAVLTCGGSSLLFTGLLGQMATANTSGTNISYGNIDANSTTASPAFNAFTGAMFTLTLQQTLPPAGTGAFVGTLNGTLNASSSNLFISFGGAGGVSAFNIAGVNYTVQNPTLIVAPTTQGGVTTIQGIATASTVIPEPATVLLMGSGLAALGFFGARRKKI
jgi:hypothetical protein